MTRRLGGALLIAASLPGVMAAQFSPADPPAIKLRGATFRPLAGEQPPLPPGLIISAYGPEERGYYLVQSSGPITEAWKAAVAAAGAELLNYVPDFAFKVRMTPVQASRVERVAGVAWVGLFHPGYKLAPNLVRSGARAYLVTIERGAEIAAAAGAVAAAGAQVLSRDGRRLTVLADASQLEAVAHVLDVASVENYLVRKKHNEYGGGAIMGAAAANAAGYTGSTQVIAVADTGLGNGTAASAHAHIPASRIAAIYNWPGSAAGICFSSVVDDGAVDVDTGHGTHTALSAVGGGGLTGEGKGTAPGASLIFQAVENWATTTSLCQLFFGLFDGYYLVGLPADIRTLFDQAHTAGARIHSNSWGIEAAGDYTTESADADDFVWSHRDLTITFSAGNSGTDANSDGLIDFGSMAAPATAKNLIAVGASENDRQAHWECDTALTYTNCAAQGGQNSIFTYGAAWPANYPANPVRDDPSAGNAGQMAAFSSRGPSEDGRIKPDVVAPGTWVLSGYSDRFQQQYDPSPNPRNNLFQYDGWGFPRSSSYKYLGGTSMSNPLVAGGAAVVRDFYQQTAGLGASAALVKATLINSAVDLLDENNDGFNDNAHPIPNNHEGWGRVNLAAATDGGHQFVDQTTGLATGAAATVSYAVGSGATPFKATLVWTDFPSATTSAIHLVNDLDLRVTAPDGTVYLGNVFSGGWSQVGGAADRINNVENVYVASPAPGTWTVEVRGFNVPSGPQPFAFVVDAGFGAPPPPPAPAAPSGLTAAAVSSSRIDLVWTDNSSNEEGFEIERCQGSGCTTFAKIGQVGANVAAFSDTTAAASTTYAYRVRAFNAGGASGYTNTASAATPPPAPAAPSGLTATAVSSGRIDLAWADNSTTEDGFEVERCQGSACTAFVKIVQVGANATAYSDTNLSASTTYQYRVRATNAGGASGYSNLAGATTPAPPPPADPSGLAATAVSSSRVDLAWTDNSTNEDGFEVERCQGSGCTTFAKIGQVGANVATFSDTTAAASTTYAYRARAFNAGGASGYSNVASATTPAPPAPAAPSGLTATAVSSTRIDLAWTDNATNEDAFEIERCQGSGCTTFAKIGQVGANVAAFSDTTGAASTTYAYRVRAVNAGGASGYSNTATATTAAAPPAAPTGLTATAVSSSRIDLAWTDNSTDEDFFEVESCQGAGCTTFARIALVSANILGFSDTNLLAGTTYQYRVRAVNAGGASGYSNTASATTPAPPPPAAPSGLTATAVSSTRIDLAWTDNATNEDAFEIERCQGSGCTTFAKIAQVGANVAAFSDTTAAASTTYAYRVRAVNAGGASGYSNTATAATAAPAPPAAPTGLTATAVSSSRIDLAWTDNSTDEDFFEVESCQGAGCTTFARIALVSANILGFSDTNLLAGTTYQYRVRAVNAGGASGYSNTAAAITAAPAPPPAPAGPSGLTATAVSSTRIDLAWTDNATNEDAFEIERCQGSGCTTYAKIAQVGANVVAFSDTTVAARTTYAYRVRAFNAGGSSGYTNTASATTPPASPSHVGDLDGASISLGKGFWNATVTMTVHDANHNSIGGATVTGFWSGDYSGSASCTTDGTGRCSITTSEIHNSAKSTTFTVSSISHASVTYAATENHDPDGDSSGTAITVRKP